MAQFDSNAVFNYDFDLSKKVIIENRTVTGILALFGDLGGLYDFLAALIAFGISRLQSYFFKFDFLKSVFRQAKSKLRFSDVQSGSRIV